MSRDPVQSRANLPGEPDEEFPDIPPSRKANIPGEEKKRRADEVVRRPHQHASRSHKRAEYLRENAIKLMDDTKRLHDEVSGNFLSRILGRSGGSSNHRNRRLLGGISHQMLRTFMIVIGLIMWFIAGVVTYKRVIRPASFSNKPRQGVVSSSVQADSCPAAARAVGSPAQEVSQPPSSVISEAEAEQRADKALSKYFDYSRSQAPALASAPDLLRATLPDGQEKLIYARVWVPVYDQNLLDVTGASASQSSDRSDAAVAYVDARTGQPLAIYSSVSIADPLLANGCSETFAGEVAENLHATVQRIGPTLAMIVTLLVGGLMLFVWESARNARRSRSGKSSDQDEVDLAEVNRRNQNIDPDLENYDI